LQGRKDSEGRRSGSMPGLLLCLTNFFQDLSFDFTIDFLPFYLWYHFSLPRGIGFSWMGYLRLRALTHQIEIRPCLIQLHLQVIHFNDLPLASSATVFRVPMKDPFDSSPPTPLQTPPTRHRIPQTGLLHPHDVQIRSAHARISPSCIYIDRPTIFRFMLMMTMLTPIQNATLHLLRFRLKLATWLLQRKQCWCFGGVVT